jgi:hypothetical protein
MRLKIPALAIPLGLTAMVVFLPRFTAQQTESRRKHDLLGQSAQAAAPVDCPVGDRRDALLAHPFHANSAWVPVCREVPPAPGKVIVERESRASYADCREQLQKQRQAACFLNEPLAFLADELPRTLARIERADAAGRLIVWVTPQPLAWGDNLIEEHRRYLVFFLFCAMFSWLLAAASLHGRAIHGSQRRMQPGSSRIPRRAEFWLLFFLHPYSQSYPVDLEEDYELWLNTLGRQKADAMCWLHVRRALPELILMHVRSWFPVLGRFLH